LQDVVDSISKLVELNYGDIVVDVGANDGTTLSMYPSHVTKIAFEPSLNIAPELAERCDYMIPDYFNADAYPLYLKAKVVTSLAMFYDLPDPVQFTLEVASILAEDGVWIMQISDLRSMLETNLIENVCHEHLEYYRTLDIVRLVNEAGLEVFRIEHNEVNGGSLRYYIAWAGTRAIEENVGRTYHNEMDYFNSPEGSIEAFAERINKAGNGLVNWLKDMNREGWSVYGLGASTKANTLLQYFDIDKSLIQAIGDLNPDKFGKRMVGSNVPIMDESHILELNPDAIIVFVWHFREFFIKKLTPYMQRGGVVVFPFPEPQLLYIAPYEPDILSQVSLLGYKDGD
jgi:hypothetical protein